MNCVRRKSNKQHLLELAKNSVKVSSSSESYHCPAGRSWAFGQGAIIYQSTLRALSTNESEPLKAMKALRLQCGALDSNSTSVPLSPARVLQCQTSSHQSPACFFRRCPRILGASRVYDWSLRLHLPCFHSPVYFGLAKSCSCHPSMHAHRAAVTVVIASSLGASGDAGMVLGCVGSRRQCHALFGV